MYFVCFELSPMLVEASESRPAHVDAYYINKVSVIGQGLPVLFCETLLTQARLRKNSEERKCM